VHLDRPAGRDGGGLGQGVLTPGGSAARQQALFDDAGLERRNGTLWLGGVSLTEIVQAAGTPAYVYNVEAIRSRYQELKAALEGVPHRIDYAVKANACPAVLAVLRELDSGCDIVSIGELRRVEAAGFSPDRVVFSGVGKRPDELRAAVEARIGQINIESLEELDELGAVAAARHDPVRVGIRVNPDVTVETHPYTRTAMAAAKFGIPADQVIETAERIRSNPRLRLVGLAMHVGSQVLDPAPFVAGAARLAELLIRLRALGCATVDSLDLGGGLGIRYNAETPLAPARLARAIRPVVDSLGVTVRIEPGRFLVGSAGVLLTTVLYRKHAGGTDFVVVDAGMNDLERPSRYQAYHEIVAVENGGRNERPVDIVGPICESGDFLALGRLLPEVERGDVLAILGAGAYGFVMSSNYNDRPRPPQIVVEGGRWRLATRRETIEEVLRR
jgi:diaminopimelate decarboxylase